MNEDKEALINNKIVDALQEEEVKITCMQETHMTEGAAYTKLYKWYLSGGQQQKDKQRGGIVNKEYKCATCQGNIRGVDINTTIEELIKDSRSIKTILSARRLNRKISTEAGTT